MGFFIFNQISTQEFLKRVFENFKPDDRLKTAIEKMVKIQTLRTSVISDIEQAKKLNFLVRGSRDTYFTIIQYESDKLILM